MSGSSTGGTRWLIPFSYVITLIVPIVGLLFALFLYREGENGHAAAVGLLAIVWSAVLFFYIL